MNKKIMLLALAAVSAVMLAVPAFASALIPLHLSSTPVGAKTLDDVGANPTLSTTGGTTVECGTFKGTATFETSTTGTIELTFTEGCKEKTFGSSCASSGEPAGSIATTKLQFHLVTLANNVPGVLITPNAGHFASFTCGIIPITVGGTGVIGKITSPGCNQSSTEATIDFNATAHGVQEFNKVAGTETIYQLKKGEENAAQDATGKLTLGTAQTLTCT